MGPAGRVGWAAAFIGAAVVAWWVAGLCFVGVFEPGRRPAFLLDAEHTDTVAHAGLLGGAALGVAAGRLWRALVALVLALGLGALLTEVGPWALDGTGSDRILPVLATVLAVASLAGAVVGVAARKTRAGVALLVFLAAALALDPAAHRLGLDATDPLVTGRQVLVGAAAAVAFALLPPVRAVLTAVVGLAAYLALLALSTGAANAVATVRGGLDPGAPGAWRDLLDTGFEASRAWLTSALPGYPALALALTIGTLAGLWLRASARLRSWEAIGRDASPGGALP